MLFGYCCSEADFFAWLSAIGRERVVWYPQREGAENWNFRKLTPGSAYDLEGYRPTVVPPGRQIMPDREVLFEFRKLPEGGIEFNQLAAREPQILAGVRPCDLHAIEQMDTVHADEPADPHYLDQRRQTSIIAVNCLQPCDERAFCASTGSLHARGGADLYVTLEEGEAIVEVTSSNGKALLEGVSWSDCPDASERRKAAEAKRPVPFGRQLEAAPDQLGAMLSNAYHSPVWKRYAEQCFSCGTCNIVCPTCYCFEVCDELSLDEQSGKRTRTWDGCMIPDFAAVAGGHNFRAECAERQRHRIKRKFEYLPKRFGSGSFCVGCGRCDRQCTTGIDIFDMVNDVAREAQPSP